MIAYDHAGESHNGRMKAAMIGRTRVSAFHQ